MTQTGDANRSSGLPGGALRNKDREAGNWLELKLLVQFGRTNTKYSSRRFPFVNRDSKSTPPPSKPSKPRGAILKA